MGSRIVITSFGSFGDVFPYIGMALGLKERGHEPVLATSEFYRERIADAGIEFRPIRPDVDPGDRETVARIMDPRWGTRYIIQDLMISALRHSYTDLAEASAGADLLVSHPITFAAPLVAEKLGLRWASTVLAPISFFSAHDLPVFPAGHWVKELERIPGAADFLVRVAKGVTRPWVAAVAGLRHELGLTSGANPIFEGQHSPGLVLALFSKLLATPQPDWPPNVRITGAVPYNGPATGRPLSPELQAFIEEGPPPVVFTLGSAAVGAAGDFYVQSVEAVRSLGRRAVLLVGPHVDNRPPGQTPPDIHLESFAPHEALFPRASAIVHQGGAGTLHQGLRAGRPTLVVPFAHDQPDNAYRVERLGVSRTLQAKRYSARRAVRELERLLSNQDYATRAREIAREVRAEDGIAAACDAIEAYLAA